ncbi:MAG TPA: isoaspartyl peptidase/L-asparaginase [Flavobacterium sp.]|jgi:L-asparaginase
MKIIIHGGFFSESSKSDDMKTLKQDALRRIVRSSYDYMRTHSAVDTVVYAVSLLEDDPLFNAGTGSQIQSDGKIRMSAAVMDGETLKMSGVINIENVKNPVKVAHKLMAFDDKVLGGIGANDFAEKHGYEYYSPETEERRKEYEEKKKSKGQGTVGCVAMDQDGKIAVATSTGGKGFEMPGRISDSPTVAGNYANKHCGVSITGVGEDIVSGAVAAKIVTRVTDGFTLDLALVKTFGELKPFDGFAGAIAIDSEGNFGHMDSHPMMTYASFDGDVLDVFD